MLKTSNLFRFYNLTIKTKSGKILQIDGYKRAEPTRTLSFKSPMQSTLILLKTIPLAQHVHVASETFESDP